MADKSPAVLAAGTVPWRRRDGRVEVAVIHRPRHDDWSWPKGKLDEGEYWTTAAVRETREETGLVVRLTRPLPTNYYRVARGSKNERRKEVRYWVADVSDDGHTHDQEVDDLRWLTPSRARKLLTYPRDRRQIDAFVSDPTRCRTLAIVRHAKAVSRKQWKGDDDRLRPLDEKGVTRAEQIIPVLAAYGIDRVVSSPSARCADTVAPFIDAHGPEAQWDDRLSEEGHAASPKLLHAALTDALAGTDPVALCSHGPVLGPLLDDLVHRFRTPGKNVKRPLRAAAGNGLAKGEVMLLHLSTDKRPAVLAVERHRP